MRGLVAILCLAGAAMAGCDHTPALLLSVDGDAAAEQVDLYLRNDASGEVVFHSGFVQVVDTDGNALDLTQRKLKIALRLDNGGKYTLLLVGVIGPLLSGKPTVDATQLFWAKRLTVDGATQLDAHLITVPHGDDADLDLWPDAIDFLAHVPAAAALYGDHPELLDCDDKIDSPLRADGTPLMLRADQINPFTVEICGDGYDEACNGDADEACIDGDGDGDPAGSDCDDADPKRHRPTAADPYPDPPNCCGYNLGKQDTPDATHNYLGEALCPMMRCGDGIDEACSGGDTTCVIDADCDGSPAPPLGGDCDDTNADIHPGAVEICNNGINESCNPLGADVGCVPCDLDGDGYQRDDKASGCPDASDAHPGLADCDDEDAGIHPGATLAAGGKEGGINTQGRLATALKGLCRKVYEPTGTTGTSKVAVAGYTVGDADCNGTAFEGCPTAACDADGDGWPNAGCGSLPGPYDCDDTNPTIFPGAPDLCGDGIDGSCAGADTACAGLDKDGDGYLPPADCDDNNKNVHPFAMELCNGVDDDCDGEIDEGNPDPTGASLVAGGVVTSCTDNDVGECGTKKGYCVCSPTKSGGAVNAAARTQCPGESATSARAPRCFGAGQPAAQTCDDALVKDEDCDGRVDAPDGKNLVIKGMPCGLSVGVCKPGVAIACVVTPSKPWYGAAPPAGHAHWECSSDTVAASPEQCNGLDDDCDGGLPTDEVDSDGDKYLACMPCVPPLASGITACGDCQPGDAASHPGAAEQCDGVDNNCDGQIDETPNACTGQGKACCFANGGACQDLTTDNRFCGACNVSCINQPFTNVCKNSACICKTKGSPCASGNWCNAGNNGGTCEACSDNTHCGPTCLPCSGSVTCSGGTLSGGTCNGSSCGGTATCLGNYGCADATTCKVNCSSDADCGTNRWCKTGLAGLNTCEARQSKNTACNDNNCATSGCLQCTGGGGSACPAGSGHKCP